MAGRYDVDVYIGDSWPAGPPGTEFIVTVQTGPDGGPFTELDLTGVTVTADIKQAKDDTAAVASFTVDLKDQVTEKGKLGLRLKSTDTESLLVRTYHWDLQLEWDTETRLTPLAGLVKATGDVTRP